MKKGHVSQRHGPSCPRDSAGTLLEHRCRGPWKFTVDFGRRPDGGRRQVTRSGFTTKREAQRALDEELERQFAGVSHEPALTVGRFFEQWLAGKRNLRETTRRSYTMHVRLYLEPALGHYRLQDLRADHIDALYSDLLEGRYAKASASTVHHVHRTLRSALNTAVKRRLIAWNPAVQVELPEHRPARSSVWEPQHIAAFLDTAHGHRLSALFHLIAFTGMRRGEAIGLHWRDVDLERAHVVVAWQITEANDGPRLGAPKTAAGARVVPIDPMTVDVLRQHRAAQQAERAAWGEAWQEHGLVFTRENGALLRPDVVTHTFGKLVRAAGVPRIRLHDLRHTHASLALAAGVDIKVVSDRLGHSTTHITANLYTHVVPAVARSAADAIAAAVAYTRRTETTDVVRMWSAETVLAGERAPPGGEVAGQSGRPRGTRTHNPRIK
ncbi:tyrosine-type recombinase/integrase, partial [Kineococcus glutinatus]|uniref:site-specific integrase n=1 Tax=Kineococcus glutinatus TaxID=1070872 RepID=UPI0031E77666